MKHLWFYSPNIYKICINITTTNCIMGVVLSAPVVQCVAFFSSVEWPQPHSALVSNAFPRATAHHVWLSTKHCTLYLTKQTFREHKYYRTIFPVTTRTVSFPYHSSLVVTPSPQTKSVRITARSHLKPFPFSASRSDGHHNAISNLLFGLQANVVRRWQSKTICQRP